MDRLGPADRPGARRVDVEGRAVLPGLIDCHVAPRLLRIPDAGGHRPVPGRDGAINAVLNAEKILKAGYTTVRDLAPSATWPSPCGRRWRLARIRGRAFVASGRVLHGTSGLADTLPACWENCCGFGLRVGRPPGDPEGDPAAGPRRRRQHQARRQRRRGQSPHAHTWMTTLNEEEITMAVHEKSSLGADGRRPLPVLRGAEVRRAAAGAGHRRRHGTRYLDRLRGLDLLRRSTTVLVPTLCTLYACSSWRGVELCRSSVRR